MDSKEKNELVLNKAEVKKELLHDVKKGNYFFKLAYYGHTTRKQGSCLEMWRKR